MSRTLYSCAMSLDGFITGPGGDMQWMGPYLGPHPVSDSLPERIGSLLIGRRTFDGDDPNRGTDHEGAFGGAWHGPSFVLTHRPPPDPPDDPDLRFVTDLAAAVSAARSAAGERYVCILGADVARQCLATGLVDEILVFVVPVLLGEGTPLFAWPGGHQVDLVTRDITHAPSGTSLWFDVSR